MKIDIKEELRFSVRAFLAGFMISIGAIANLYITSFDSSNIWLKLAGSAMFSIGLVFVILLQLKLFTGMNALICDMSWKEYYRVPLCFIYNAIGCWLGALLIFKTSIGSDVIARSIELTNYKLNANLGYTFLSAIMCGVLITLSILGFRYTKEKSVSAGVFCIVLPVMVFILIGVDHSVANLVYFDLATLGGNGFSPKIILHSLVAMLGNIVGGALMPTLLKIIAPRESKIK